MTYDHLERLSEAHVLELHALYQGEWWSRGRTIEQVRTVLAHSDLVFGIVEKDHGRLVAFARVLTDRVFKALVFDVIVAPEHRGRGCGAMIVEAILRHPQIRSVRHLELYCLPELAPFYRRWGFSEEVGGVLLMRRDPSTA
jgi:GNAT superfamily N-acetyltransferase